MENKEKAIENFCVDRRSLTDYSLEESNCLMSFWDNGSLAPASLVANIVVMYDSPLIDFLITHNVWTVFAWEYVAASGTTKLREDPECLFKESIERRMTRLVYDKKTGDVMVDTMRVGRGWTYKFARTMYPLPGMSIERAEVFRKGASPKEDFEEYLRCEEIKKFYLEEVADKNDFSQLVTKVDTFVDIEPFKKFSNVQYEAPEPQTVHNYEKDEIVKPLEYEAVDIGGTRSVDEVTRHYKFLYGDELRHRKWNEKYNELICADYMREEMNSFMNEIPGFRHFKYIFDDEKRKVDEDDHDLLRACAVITYVYGDIYGQHIPELRAKFYLPIGKHRIRYTESRFFEGKKLPEDVLTEWYKVCYETRWRNACSRIANWKEPKGICYWSGGLKALLVNYSYSDGYFVPGGFDDLATGLFMRPAEYAEEFYKKTKLETSKEICLFDDMKDVLSRMLLSMRYAGIGEERAFIYLISEYCVMLYAYLASTYTKTLFGRGKRAKAIVNVKTPDHVTSLSRYLLDHQFKLYSENDDIKPDAPTVVVMDFVVWDDFEKGMSIYKPRDNLIIVLRLRRRTQYLIPALMQHLFSSGYGVKYTKNSLFGEAGTHYVLVGGKRVFPRFGRELESFFHFNEHAKFSRESIDVIASDDLAMAFSLMKMSVALRTGKEDDDFITKVSPRYAKIE